VPTSAKHFIAIVNRRPPVFPVAFLLVSVLNLAGCATQKGADGWRHDHDMVINSLEDLSARHAEDAERIDQLQQRVDALEQQTQQQSAQIEAISGALESVQVRRRPAAATLKSGKSPSAARLVEKIGQVEASIKQATSAEPAADHGEEEKNIYTAAYLALKSDRFDEASQQFARLLDQYPQGEFTDQAWYWLAESLMAQHKSDKALKAYKHVVDHYPDSVKYSASLLRMGGIYRDRKRYGDAKAVLGRLLREHGDAPSAKPARQMLLEIDAVLKPKGRGK